MIKQLTEPVLDFIYPAFCVVCESDGEWLCEACARNILSSDPIDLKPGGFKDFFTIGRYANPVLREVIRSVKYRRAAVCLPYIKELILRFSRDHILFHNLIRRSDIRLFYVPSDSLRVKERGMDHMREIADIFIDLYPNIELKNSLIKTRSILPNASLPSNAARKGNTDDAFVVTERIDGTCLLIDDVCTTGATMIACRKALKAAGAKEVYGFTLAVG